MISYQVSFPNPNSHLYHVKLGFQNSGSLPVTLVLPNWIRGSYMIRDFARNIVSISATCDGNAVDLSRIDKSTWQLSSCAGQVEVHYTVYALDLSVRSAHLDNTHGFFNGTSLYLAVVDRQSEAITITIAKSQSTPSDWTVKTTLSCEQVDECGFGDYSAMDYEDAIDHPVEISASHDIHFSVFNVPHSMHFSGDLPDSIDDNRIAYDLQRICSEHQAMFARQPALDQYRFMTMVIENGYGGLEHKKSTALVCSPGDLPRTRRTDEVAYRRFLGLCSHEYFHLWNVKRITPLNFQQSDLANEAYSTLLWAFEGITSYYDDLAMLRCGCVNQEEYLALLAEMITRYLRSGGRHRQTLADSSFDAWTKFYKQDENVVNAVISYYTKGALVALGLDMQIRLATDNQQCLDDVMRALWEQYGKAEKGIADADMERFIAEQAGVDLGDFFDLCIRSTEELPLKDWLAVLGFGLRIRPDEGDNDNGRFIKSVAEKTEGPEAMSWGCKLKPGSCDVQFVYNDSAAEKAGIAPGDSLVAIDGIRVKPDNFQKLLNNRVAGESSEVLLFRRDRIHCVQVSPATKQANTCDLYLLDDNSLSAQQKAIRLSWQTSSNNV